MLMELSSSTVCVYNQFSFESTTKYDKTSQYLRAKIAVMDFYVIADFQIHKLCVTSVASFSFSKGVHVPNVLQLVSYDELLLHYSIIKFALYVISDIQLLKLSM